MMMDVMRVAQWEHDAKSLAEKPGRWQTRAHFRSVVETIRATAASRPPKAATCIHIVGN